MNFSGMLLDSDVLAEIRKADPDPAVVAFLRRRSFRHMYISVLSIGELKGLYPYPETDRWITELLERFGDHVINVDAPPRVRVCVHPCVNSCENPLSSVNRRRVSSLIRGMIEGR